MLRIFNSLSGSKEEFIPLQPPQVGLYVCGITPYDYCHLGHARTYVTFDVIYRYLEAYGFTVTFVKNFTDVDDKIINRANAEGVTAAAISDRYIQAYEEDMAALLVRPPARAPKVTEHIAEIVALIERLVGGGHAYAIGGDVYFEARTFARYLALSHHHWDDLSAGARVDVDERKRDPADFALWKSAKPGEPSWPSPWGAGRPGWHIECSAMALQFLGQTFDLHGGGRDLIFPHHENEVAQSEAATGKPYAKYWLHSGMLNIDDEKMSKSLGNFFTIKEVLRMASGEALRASFLVAHYRGQVGFDVRYVCPVCGQEISREAADSLSHAGHQFSAIEARGAVVFGSIEEAEKRLHYGYQTLARAEASLKNKALSDGPVFKPELSEGIWERFCAAMDDDFNTAAALSTLSPIWSFLNELLARPLKPREQSDRTVSALTTALKRCHAVLGLYQGDPQAKVLERRARLVVQRGIDVTQVEALIAKRALARAERNFAEADIVRNSLTAMGIGLQDGDGATTWEFVEAAPKATD